MVFFSSIVTHLITDRSLIKEKTENKAQQERRKNSNYESFEKKAFH
jgi:hypothetical protein